MTKDTKDAKRILRVGVIGCGNIFRSHSPVYVDNPYAVLVGFYDRIQNRAEAWFSQFKIEMDLLQKASANQDSEEDRVHLQRCKIFASEGKIYTEVADIIENVDVIDICAPTYSHAPYALWALKKNKAVMVEKPPARTSLETKKILEIVEEKGSLFQINENFLWQQYIHEFNKVLRDGKIGKLQEIIIKLGHGGPSWGWQNHFLNPSLSGGGILLDMGSHAIGALIGILGNEFILKKVQSLQMQSGTERERTIQKIDGENEYYVQKILVEDDATIKLWLSYQNNPDPVIALISVSWSKTYNEIHLEGTAGTCRLGFDHLKRKIIHLEQNNKQPEQIPLIPQGRDSHQLQVLDFLKSVGTGMKPWANHTVGHKIQTIISSAYLSNLNGYEEGSKEGSIITPKDLEKFYEQMANKIEEPTILIEEIVYKFMIPFTSTYYAPGSEYTTHLNLKFD